MSDLISKRMLSHETLLEAHALINHFLRVDDPDARLIALVAAVSSELAGRSAVDGAEWLAWLKQEISNGAHVTWKQMGMYTPPTEETTVQ